MNFNYLFFFLFPVLLFSQNTIHVKVVDENNLPISRAIVILSQNNNQIIFGTTNENGLLEKQIASGEYDFKISKLGFATIYNAIVIYKGEDFEFVLKEEVNKLENVVITSRPKIMRIKEDTISYNLKAVIDGTENKIEDVIKKLPGLEVDSDGKVLYKGLKIENVLVDGNEFFGNKHQMATQNIDADMIEGIDLLTGYSGFAKASGGQKGIALNLKTKDSYKNKWITDIELAAGLNVSFRFHSNSFKFFKKGNLAIISDYNTIAKTPISRDDYNEMRIVSEVDSENGEFKSVETPTFLNPNAFIKDKTNAFIGLNYTSLLGKRSKITMSNIFNKTNIAEENARLQTNIGETQSQYSFLENKAATYSLNNSSLKWEFNKSKTTFISYVVGFTPNGDDDNQDLLRSANELRYSKSNTNFSFAHVAKVQSTLLKTINYKFTARHSVNDNRQKVDLFSQQNLFDRTFGTINQNQKNQEVNISLNNAFTITKKSNVFSLKINFLSQQERFNSYVVQNDTIDIGLKLQRQSIQANLSWAKKWHAKLQSMVGFNTTALKSQFKGLQDAFTRYEPNLSLTYTLSGLNKISFSYALDHQLLALNQVQQTDFIFDFQTLVKPSLVSFNQVLPKNTFSLQYFGVNSKNQSVVFSTLSYDVEQNAVSNNTKYNADFIETTAITTKNRKSIKGLVLYDLKFKRLPFSIKTTLFYLKSIGFSQFDGVNNQVEIQNLTNRLQLISNFKKSVVQFNIDYNFIRRTLEQNIADFKNTTQNHQLTLSLRGKNSTKLKWDLGLTMDSQDSGFRTNKTFFLNANIQYVFAKDFKFIFNGNNMLNLNKSKLISTSFNQSFFTESVVSIRRGYVMIGVNYSL